METAVSVLIVVLIVAAFIASVLTLRKEGFTAEGWSKVREIIYQAIDDGIKLYQSQEMTPGELVEFVAQMIYNKIQASNLPLEDKKFWNLQRIKLFIAPVILEIIDRSKINAK